MDEQINILEELLVGTSKDIANLFRKAANRQVTDEDWTRVTGMTSYPVPEVPAKPDREEAIQSIRKFVDDYNNLSKERRRE